jgi:PAS domain S-box-containing protein/putative nucleotidyltransferase with HDIG domain
VDNFLANIPRKELSLAAKALAAKALREGPANAWLRPAGIAGAYALAGALWIVYSDALLKILVVNRDAFAAWGSAKGLIFIAVTAVVIFFLLRRSMTAEVQTARAFTQSRHLNADILDALPDILFTLDESGHIKTWNHQALAATGYNPGDVAEKSMLEFATPEDKPHASETLATVLAGRTMALRLRVRYKDGTVVPYHFVSVPLRSDDGHVIGAVFDGRDISAEVRGENALRRSLRGYEHILEQTISAIAALVEQRDRYLAGHQERVTQLALAMAQRMGLDPDRCHGLRLAALCHDIGKIHVPAEILSKPGRLSAAEFAMIKRHPHIGYEILNKIDFPWPIAEIVRQHHERYDGSGYPRGLSGDSIRLEAQILGVADVVEAMMSHRPYRPGLGADVALEEIRNGRGTRYNAQVADACLAAFSAGGFKLDAVVESRAAS